MLSKHAPALTVKSALLFAFLFLGACATTAPQPKNEAPAIPAAATPEQLERKASQARADTASRLFLQAAQGYMEAGDLASALRTFESIEPGLLKTQELSGYQLLQAEVLLEQGDWQRAGRALAQIPQPATAATDTSLSPAQRKRHEKVLELSARVRAASGDYAGAADLLIRAAGDNPARNDQIWSWIRRASGEQVRRQSGGEDGIRRAWWELQQEMLSSTSGEEQKGRLLRWQKRHPGHPAARSLPGPLAVLMSSPPGPSQIALLLPLSGPFTRAGESARDGFLSAYLHAGLESPPKIRIYDSESAPLPLLYEQILADGAELIVGPLQKPLVTELNELNPDVPVLALNYLDTDQLPAADFLQLGLAIEDEARSISARLRAEGARRVLVVHNYEDWSIRAQRQLAADWTEPGPQSMTVQAITDVRTITEAIGSAMQVDDSRARRDELARILGTELEFLPRARGDFDGVVALVGNTEANALVPALRFHFASQLPVYAGSQTIRGTQPAQRRELEGFHVAELPWLLEGNALLQEMESPFALSGNPFASIYALGVDAYAVSARFESLRSRSSTRLLGSTGELTLGEDGQFRRAMSWAVIRDGRIQPELPLAATGADTAGGR